VRPTGSFRRRVEQEAEEYGITTDEEKEAAFYESSSDEPKVAFPFDQDSQITPKSSTSRQSQASV
jgi:hypothetical protein